MSNLLMCDSCGEPFSVNEEGWLEFTERVKPNEVNPYNSSVKQRHLGPCCARGSQGQIPPSFSRRALALEGRVEPRADGVEDRKPE